MQLFKNLFYFLIIVSYARSIHRELSKFDHLDGEEADRVFLHEGKVVTIMEAEKLGKNLWAALDKAK